MWPISDDQLRTILQHLPTVVYQDSHEPHPRTIYLSPNADAILGNGADEHLRDPDLWWRSIDPRDRDDLMTAWTRAYEGEQPYVLDYRYHRPDGRVVWLREHASPVRDEHGAVIHWQGVLLDVTAERTAADVLAESEARYRSLIEHLPAAVYTLTNDDTPRIMFVSPKVEELYGYPAKRWIEQDDIWPDVVHPDDRADVVGEWEEALRARRAFERRYRIRHADGSYRWIADHLHPIFDDDGGVIAWEGMSFDVTREHETALALNESEARYERVLQQIPGVAFSLVPGTRGFDYVSPRVQDILGYPRSLWFEEDGFWRDVIHPDDHASVTEEWDRSGEQGIPFRMEYRVRHADGHIVWLRAETLPVRDADGEIERWQGLWLDITETQVAREEQARLEVRYQRLVEHAPAIVFTTDPHGAITYVGPQVEQILGYPATDWKDDPFKWASLIHPDDRARVLEAWEDASRSERPSEAEARLRLADGSYRWFRETTHPVREADGTISRWHGLTVDVHELHTATEAREAAEARARALLENVPAVVYEMSHDDERHTLYVSPHIERLLGYSRQEWLDQPDIWIELLHPDDRETELEAHDRHSSTGETWSREYRLIAADGRTVWVRDQATLVLDAEGRRSWQGVLVDVTSQRDTAELLEITNEQLEQLVSERTAALAEANALMGLEIAERRRAEREAFTARERYRILIEDMPAVAYIWRTAHHEDDEDAADYTSPKIEDVLGFTPQEWQEGACRLERLHPHDRDAVVDAMQRCEETGEPFAMEFRYFAKDGRVVWIEDHASLLSRTVDGHPGLFHGVLLDVTGRKRAEEHAADAERRFRQIAEDGPLATYAFVAEPTEPPTITIDYVSPQMADMLGYEISSWIDEPERWFEMIHPDDRKQMAAAASENWRTGAAWTVEYRMIRADGGIAWIRDAGRCVERDDLGRPIRFLGAVSDVTDEVVGRESAREELSTLRSIVGEIPAVTWIESVGADGGDPRYLYMSPQVEELLGYTAAELLVERAHFPRMIHPDDEDRIDETWRNACLAAADTWEDRWRARHRDGTYRWIHGRARRVSEPDAATLVWVGFSLDVTEEMTGRPAVPGVDAGHV